MTTTQHTPGPWYGKHSIYTDQGLIASEKTGATVALCYTSEADTALIAAAPELLAALQKIMLYAVDWTVPTAVWDEATAAIEKAQSTP